MIHILFFSGCFLGGKYSVFQDKKNDKYGIVDKNMNFLSDFIYDGVFSIDTDFARVKKDNKWGLINKNCKKVINSQFDYISESIYGIFTFIKIFLKINQNFIRSTDETDKFR